MNIIENVVEKGLCLDFINPSQLQTHASAADDVGKHSQQLNCSLVAGQKPATSIFNRFSEITW